MAITIKTRIRYVVPIAQFKSFIATQLNVNATDIDEIGITVDSNFWQVVMKETEQ